MALKPSSNVFRVADVPFPATLSMQGARFFIGSRRRTKGLFTVGMEGAASLALSTPVLMGGCHHRSVATT